MSTFETFTEDDGTKSWYKDGNLHRDGDLPAVEYPDGGKAWYQNGLQHREGAPAAEYANGIKIWYRWGKQHRDGGPSVEFSDGAKIWRRDDKKHRDDGPAVINADGTEEWWMNGVRLDEQQTAAARLSVQQEKERQLRLHAEEVVTPFRGTVNAVVAPEKAAFRKHARLRA